MWHGLNPNSWPEAVAMRRMLALRQQTPTREWPLLYAEDEGLLLVVREWPDGSVTAYTIARRDLQSRADDDTRA